MSEKKTDFDVRQFCRRLEALNASDSAYALQAISRLVIEVISRQSSVGRVFSSRDLDLTAQAIGARIVDGIIPPAKRNDHIVYLLTQVGQYGGHGRVLRDIIAATQAHKKTLILSHVFPGNSSEYDIIIRSGVEVEIAPDDDAACKTRWIAERLAALAPSKCYMMLHHFDAVLVAVAQPALTGKLVFIHNCDHALSLGVHIPHAIHVDFHPKGFFRCRVERRSGADSTTPSGYIIPLTAEDIGTRRGGHFMQRGHATTCTTGGPEKFTNMHYTESRPYLYQYVEIVGAILSTSRGTHIHVGPLPEKIIAQIRAEVVFNGLPEDRFIYIPNAPSIWKVFLDEAVDVYVGSAPYGGGRATVEAMGAGLPLIIHSNYRSNFLSVECEVYNGAMIWQNIDQIRNFISNLTPGLLCQHSAISRSYYEDNHTPQRLEDALARIDRGLKPTDPKPIGWFGDPLQDFMDEALEGMKKIATDETTNLFSLGG